MSLYHPLPSFTILYHHSKTFVSQYWVAVPSIPASWTGYKSGLSSQPLSLYCCSLTTDLNEVLRTFFNYTPWTYFSLDPSSHVECADDTGLLARSHGTLLRHLHLLQHSAWNGSNCQRISIHPDLLYQYQSLFLFPSLLNWLQNLLVTAPIVLSFMAVSEALILLLLLFQHVPVPNVLAPSSHLTPPPTLMSKDMDMQVKGNIHWNKEPQDWERDGNKDFWKIWRALKGIKSVDLRWIDLWFRSMKEELDSLWVHLKTSGWIEGRKKGEGIWRHEMPVNTRALRAINSSFHTWTPQPHWPEPALAKATFKIRTILTAPPNLLSFFTFYIILSSNNTPPQAWLLQHHASTPCTPSRCWSQRTLDRSYPQKEIRGSKAKLSPSRVAAANM